MVLAGYASFVCDPRIRVRVSLCTRVHEVYACLSRASDSCSLFLRFLRRRCHPFFVVWISRSQKRSWPSGYFACLVNCWIVIALSPPVGCHRSTDRWVGDHLTQTRVVVHTRTKKRETEANVFMDLRGEGSIHFLCVEL